MTLSWRELGAGKVERSVRHGGFYHKIIVDVWHDHWSNRGKIELKPRERGFSEGRIDTNQDYTEGCLAVNKSGRKYKVYK